MTCSDSDGGRNLYTKGKICMDGIACIEDSCNGTKINEGVCENNERVMTSITCLAGCENGACNSEDTITSETQTQSGFGAWLANLFKNKNQNTPDNSITNNENKGIEQT
jgi:hypothetical protein